MRSRPQKPPGGIPYALLVPFCVLYTLFWAIPLLQGLTLSLHAGEGFAPGPFIGTRHYEHMLRDDRFRHALAHTAAYAAGTLVIIIPLSLSLALLLQAGWRRLSGLFRFILLLPAITAPSALATLLLPVFDGESGLLNNFLLAPFGRPHLDWLEDPRWVMPALLLQGAWRWSGLMAFVLFVAIESIPRGYLEAAALAGASRWATFRSVTLPLIRPALLFVGLFVVFDAFVRFADAYVLLGNSGGSGNAGLFLITYVYLSAFRFLRFGYAAAMAYAVAPILAICLWLFIRYRAWESAGPAAATPRRPAADPARPRRRAHG